jgi:nucleotide-binding universal stress UspA family protein
MIVTALADRGVTAEPTAIESEDVVAEILRFATDGRYDVILIGTHGQGRFDGLLGSTSTKLIRKAHCSVMTIRS